MRAGLASRRCGKSKRVRRNGPIVFVASVASMPSFVITADLSSDMLPALLTRSFSGPSKRDANARTDSSDDTSSAAPEAVGPIFCAASSACACDRPVTITRNPRPASFFAVTKPIPFVPPVTIAVSIRA